MTTSEALERIPYLRGMTPEARAQLANHCAFVKVPRGGELFAEGDPPEGIYLIVSGRITLLRSSTDGRHQVLHEEGPGVTLAEVPAFDGRGYVGSAVAAEDAEALLVPRSPLLEALAANPASSVAVIEVLAARVRKLAGVVEDLSLRDVTARVAAYVHREAARAGSNRVELPATRDELAQHVGTVREQVSRALSQLKAAGAIEVEGRTVVVREPSALRAIAGAAPDGR